jgi:hypothetical protein
MTGCMSNIWSVVIIVIPPGEYPENQVLYPEPTNYLSRYQLR